MAEVPRGPRLNLGEQIALPFRVGLRRFASATGIALRGLRPGSLDALQHENNLAAIRRIQTLSPEDAIHEIHLAQGDLAHAIRQLNTNLRGYGNRDAPLEQKMAQLKSAFAAISVLSPSSASEEEHEEAEPGEHAASTHPEAHPAPDEHEEEHGEEIHDSLNESNPHVAMALDHLSQMTERFEQNAPELRAGSGALVNAAHNAGQNGIRGALALLMVGYLNHSILATRIRLQSNNAHRQLERLNAHRASLIQNRDRSHMLLGEDDDEAEEELHELQDIESQDLQNRIARRRVGRFVAARSAANQFLVTESGMSSTKLRDRINDFIAARNETATALSVLQERLEKLREEGEGTEKGLKEELLAREEIVRNAMAALKLKHKLNRASGASNQTLPEQSATGTLSAALNSVKHFETEADFNEAELTNAQHTLELALDQALSRTVNTHTDHEIIIGLLDGARRRAIQQIRTAEMELPGIHDRIDQLRVHLSLPVEEREEGESHEAQQRGAPHEAQPTREHQATAATVLRTGTHGDREWNYLGEKNGQHIYRRADGRTTQTINTPPDSFFNRPKPRN